MKNLLVINQFASIPENMFGAGERMYHLSSYLKQSGFNITVLSGGYNHLYKNYPQKKGWFTTQSLDACKFVWVSLKKYKHSSFLGRVFSWFEFVFKLFFFQINDRPDVVLVSSMSLLPIIYAIWIKFRYKAKFILEIRDIWPLTPMEIGGYSKWNPLIFFLRRIELLGYNKANYIVSVLPGFKRYLVTNGFSDKSFEWIPNGVMINTERGKKSPKVILQSNKFNVVYAGAVGKANALEHIVDACRLIEKKYPEIHVSIIGEGPEKQKLIESTSELANISFFDKVSKEEIGDILGYADVGYIGWHDKNIYAYGVSANKYNDYMLAKIPILSSSRIQDDPVLISEAGIRVNTVPKDIAIGIVELYEMSEDSRRELGMNGFRFVTSSQTYLSLAEKYINELNSVL
ncbi:putative glycosyl transferase [compost metagenome]